MIDLRFSVLAACTERPAASPQIVLRLGVACDARVHAAILRCQIRIDAPRRAYSDTERERLAALFGDGTAWSRGLRSMLWSNATIMVPAFEESTTVDLHLPCTLDLDVAFGRYFEAVGEGEVPLLLLFGGTVFVPRGDGALEVAQIPWSTEARYALAPGVYTDAVRLHYGGGAVVPLARDVFERLSRYRARAGHPTWERTVDALLAKEGGAR